jgi:PAS domain S-box-containing protein
MAQAQPIFSVSDSEYQAQEELLFRTAARLRGLLFYRFFVLLALPVVAWLYQDSVSAPVWFWGAFGLLMGTQVLRIASDYIGGNLSKNASVNIVVDAAGYTLLAAFSDGLDSPFIYFYILLSLYSVVWFDRRISMGVGGVIATCLVVLFGLHGLPVVGSTATFASMLLVLVGLALGTGEIARLVAEARARMVNAAMGLIVANKRILSQQQALRESEERLRLVLDTAEEGIFGMDLEGLCSFANRSCVEMLGYKSESQLIGKDMHRLMHHTFPDGAVYRKEDCRILNAGRSGEKAHSVDEMHWRIDGSGFPVEYWSHPVMREGRPIGIVVTFLDITERKRAETNLRRAQFMVENTPQEVWLSDVKGNLVYANRAAAASLGYDQAALARMTISDVDPVSGPLFPAQAEAMRSGHLAVFETEHRTRDGRNIPKEIRASHIGLDGKDFICGFAQDISERKRNEAELQARMERIARQQKAIALLATLPAVFQGDVAMVARFITEKAAKVVGAERVGVWLFDKAGTVLDCLDLYQATPGSHEGGARLEETLYRNEFQALRDARYVDAHDALADPRTAGYVEGYLKPLGITSMLDAGIQTGGQNYGVICFEHVGPRRHWEPDEIAFACQAADQLALAIQNRARREAEETTRKLNLELEDRVELRTQELAKSYTQLRDAFATIERAQEELVRSEKLASLGSLVAGVAHELNTPLGNSLTVATTLAERTYAFQKEMEAGALRRSVLAEFIQGTAQASDLLTRNLFKASDLISHFKQVAVDQTSAQRRPFDLAETLEEVLVTLQPQFKKTPHQMEMAIPSGIRLDSYPGPLGQVITNLVSNALVHGLEGIEAGTVKIEAAAGEAEVVLTVADNGRGISPEHQAKVFDPFFTTRLGQGGSGLGLHIVYSIITRMLGGRIALASQPGQGTTVTLHIPLSAPDHDKPAASGMAIH